jgi:hypothetical protein
MYAFYYLEYQNTEEIIKHIIGNLLKLYSSHEIIRSFENLINK